MFLIFFPDAEACAAFFESTRFIALRLISFIAPAAQSHTYCSYCSPRFISAFEVIVAITMAYYF